MSEPHVVILGAGPAGVGAAFQLRRTGRARVTLVEQRPVVGGNAGSFEVGGQRVDYGSHRLHPACDPMILADIRELLGDGLVERPRHGRIRLHGKWIHFPLKPLDLLLRLDLPFTLGTFRDMGRRLLPGRPEEGDSFASVLRGRLGSTICEQFYFPYARKIWGREPEDLSAIQMRRRVAANSFGKLARKILGQFPGVKPVGFRHYHYARNGYGTISEAYAEAAQARGAEFHLGWRVTGLEQADGSGRPWVVTATRGDASLVVHGDRVWSTLPISLLARIISPRPPEAVLEAADAIKFRAMLLVYLTLAVDHFSEYDAHYFPESDVAITRLSEPKNYAGRTEPIGRTTLCAELPCSTEDGWWKMGDAELGERVAEDLARAGIPLPAPVTATTVRRLGHAYPIYDRGYEGAFGLLDGWVEGLPGLLSYGRQGLFAHDNTHHALAMAYGAADCLVDSVFDASRWEAYRKIFETHVVED